MNWNELNLWLISFYSMVFNFLCKECHLNFCMESLWIFFMLTFAVTISMSAMVRADSLLIYFAVFLFFSCIELSNSGTGNPAPEFFFFVQYKQFYQKSKVLKQNSSVFSGHKAPRSSKFFAFFQKNPLQKRFVYSLFIFLV